jgi:dTDP-4-dehydrorhamnose reductase
VGGLAVARKGAATRGEPAAKTLVLGASGYLGRHVTAALGAENVVATYFSQSVPGAVRFDALKTQVQAILPRGANVKQAVILYAEPDIDACKRDPAASRQLNVTATISVIGQLLDLGIRPIFTSTEYVYDGSVGNYTEDDPPCPNTLYGEQKLEVERHLITSAPGSTVLRLAKVYGTTPGDGSLLTNWLRDIEARHEIKAARDQLFSPVHVNDVASVVKEVVDRSLSGLYHVAGPETYTRIGMLRRLIAATQLNANVTECSLHDLKFLDNRPFNVSMDSSKVRAATGLRFKTVREACAELASFIKHGPISARN